MQPALIYTALFALGTAAGVAASGMINALDKGITITHLTDEAATLREESDVLRKMALNSWVGVTRADAGNRLKELGIYSFTKGDGGIAAGPVFVPLKDGVVTDIENYCWRFSLECTETGVYPNGN